ncbi:MAG: hypothetical protein AAGJ46_04340 [Planctomycetota bacterium]
MKTNRTLLAAAVALATALAGSTATAQINTWTGDGATNAFSDGNNWDFFFTPDPVLFSESRIGADVPGLPDATNTLATVAADLSLTPSSRLVLGEGTQQDGTPYEGSLAISSGGQLVVQPGVGGGNGNLEVGNNGGIGTLAVSGSGALQVDGQLAANGGSGGDSSMTFSDSAAVTASSLFTERRLRLEGGGVTFSVANDAILGQFGVHEWAFSPSGAGPSVMSVAGELSLDGTLSIDTLGETPSVGDSWVIADSGSVIQGFTSIDTSAVPGLGQGVAVRVFQSGGGVNGVETNVVVEQQPVLVVNRQTGAVSIRNPGAAASIAIDSYDVLSASGGLNVGNWTSLAPSAGWQEANPSANNLSELNALSSESFDGGSDAALGEVFEPVAMPFGVDTEDLDFKFSPLGEGEVDGLVVYEGIPTDTLTLNIDRTTGDAQIINGFRSSISIDTYTVTSESGSLDVGAGGFDAIGGDWQVAESDPDAVSELNPLSQLTLGSGAAQSLGSLFDFDAVGAEEDLVFEFSLPTDTTSRFGKVVFADELSVLPQGLDGDFNDDGLVDAADYTVWRDNLGSSSDALNGNGTGDPSGLVVIADYLLWRSQFGASAGASQLPASVPEPGALAIACCLAGLLGIRRQSLDREARQSRREAA